MQKERWYVEANFAAAEVKEPSSVLESEMSETFEMDSRPFTIVWMDSEEEARLWYQNAVKDFAKLRRLNEIRAEIHEAEIEGDMVRLMSLEAEVAEIEG